MKKAKVKIPAKINLTLDVFEKKDGYHEIKSLVASVSVFDEITVRLRSDGKITLKEKGIKSGCSAEKNNAVKAACEYFKEFGGRGADIILNKKIPVGGGMGGSSADIAGTLKALNLLYGEQNDIKGLADKIGSDAGYMLCGGFAVISGRGEKVSKVKCEDRFYLLIIKGEGQISAKDCYEKFDETGRGSTECTEKATEYLKNGKEEFFDVIKNDLYIPATAFAPYLKEEISELKKSGAKAALMTGSGSCVYGIFADKKEREVAYLALKKTYKERLIKANTL